MTRECKHQHLELPQLAKARLRYERLQKASARDFFSAIHGLRNGFNDPNKDDLCPHPSSHVWPLRNFLSDRVALLGQVIILFSPQQELVVWMILLPKTDIGCFTVKDKQQQDSSSGCCQITNGPCLLCSTLQADSDEENKGQ